MDTRTQAQEHAARADDEAVVLDAIRRERPRLRAWLRRQLPDQADVDDILQDAFYELVLVSRLAEPVRNAGAWLFTVIRNRVTDAHRRRRHRPLAPFPGPDDGDADADAPANALTDLLPDPDAGPEAAYTRARLVDAIDKALQALPADQRAVFIAHEIDGLSFKAMAEASGDSVNTLLSRKRYAVAALRRHLQAIHDDSTST
jgi:RNA polymerase sigma factor (sigma-70 family)